MGNEQSSLNESKTEMATAELTRKPTSKTLVVPGRTHVYTTHQSQVDLFDPPKCVLADAENLTHQHKDTKGTDIVYALKLVGDYYYIGRTQDLGRRLLEHQAGSGSEWTTNHPMECCLECWLCQSDVDEDYRTKQYMMKYGIDRVRGGSYVSTRLLPAQIQTLEKEMNSAYNECFRCGSAGHYAKDCDKQKCFKRGNVGQYAKECDLNKSYHQKESHVENTIIPSCDKCGNPGHVRASCKSLRDIRLTCERCGKIGHSKLTCYVKL